MMPDAVEPGMAGAAAGGAAMEGGEMSGINALVAEGMLAPDMLVGAAAGTALDDVAEVALVTGGTDDAVVGVVAIGAVVAAE